MIITAAGKIKKIGGVRLVGKRFLLKERDCVIQMEDGKELFFKLNETRTKNDIPIPEKQNLQVGDNVIVTLELFSKIFGVRTYYSTILNFIQIEKNDKMHNKEAECKK